MGLNKQVKHDQIVKTDLSDSVLLSSKGEPFGIFYDQDHSGKLLQKFNNVKTRIQCLDICVQINDCFVVVFWPSTWNCLIKELNDPFNKNQLVQTKNSMTMWAYEKIEKNG